MHLIQFDCPDVGRCLGVIEGDAVRNVTALDPTLNGVYRAFRAARAAGRRLAEYVEEVLGHGKAPVLDYRKLLEGGRMLPPVTEEAGIRLLVSGTGLTHTGSVQQRDQMHAKTESPGPRSDSRKMFELGLAGGRPVSGQRGTAPEWFYKGDGRILRGPGQPLDVPGFAPDGGEEPEVAGVYAVDDQGVPWRLGFVQGNEWSDHVTENVNYLYLAPSKLRVCAIGPELVTDHPFADCRGRCRVLRGERVLYDSGELATGEKNMCHSLTNLEDHHFKFPQHRLPGDVHVHFFGTSKLSFQNRKWKYETDDVVEVAFEGFGAPLQNPVLRAAPETMPVVVDRG